MDTPTTTRQDDKIKMKYFDYYADATDTPTKKVGQLRRDINRGKSLSLKHIIVGYGRLLEQKGNETMKRIKRHKEEILALKKEHNIECEKRVRDMYDKQQEKIRLYEDFISTLDKRTIRRFDDMHYDKYGSGSGIKAKGVEISTLLE